ncbi:MAG TPA: Hsp20/alpha crystallin family protein [Streptosporangiaceae bacterium]|jgi:HSP20 family protein
MAMLPVHGTRRSLVSADPTREIEDIYERMGQLVNAAFGDLGAVRVDMPWMPAADLTETDDSYLVHVELPGVQKDQLNVEVFDRELRIDGEISEQSDGRRHRSSRRTGRFESRTVFPGDIKASGVSAELADGVLTVTVPKSEAAKPSRVQVTAKKQSGR